MHCCNMNTLNRIVRFRLGICKLKDMKGNEMKRKMPPK
jgi:hypothetical protein